LEGNSILVRVYQYTFNDLNTKGYEF